MVAIGDGPMSRIRPSLWLNGTTPGWFGTMGIPLRTAGTSRPATARQPSRCDRERNVRAPVPAGRAADRAERATGIRAATRYEIVGVVGDTVYTTPREGMLATMYVPMAQRKPSEFWPTVLLTGEHRARHPRDGGTRRRRGVDGGPTRRSRSRSGRSISGRGDGHAGAAHRARLRVLRRSRAALGGRRPLRRRRARRARAADARSGCASRWVRRRPHRASRFTASAG